MAVEWRENRLWEKVQDLVLRPGGTIVTPLGRMCQNIGVGVPCTLLPSGILRNFSSVFLQPFFLRRRRRERPPWLVFTPFKP